MGSAVAADETGKWYVNPQYGYTYVDDARFVDDGEHYGLSIGKHLSEMWSLELNGYLGSFDGTAGLELDIEAASLDALIVFSRAAAVSPYFTLGAGYLTTEYSPGSGRDGGLVQGGLGLMIDVAQNSSRTFVFQLRPEAKVRYDWAGRDDHDDFHDYLVQLGFVFNFGSPPAAAAAPVAAAAAAAAVPPPAPPPPPPNPDLDGDGVRNETDQCPNTPRGTAVNAVGCTRTDPVTLRGVTFDNDSATLTPASGPLLAEVAADLKRHPRLKVELRGYTDSVGAAAYNLQLSQRRADAVREFLISQGVAATQLTAKGFGEENPVADNRTAPGRLENRRVVMQIVDNPGDVEVRGEAPNP